MICEICNKDKKDARFEASEEMNICDGCLFEKQQGKKCPDCNDILCEPDYEEAERIRATACYYCATCNKNFEPKLIEDKQ